MALHDDPDRLVDWLMASAKAIYAEDGNVHPALWVTWPEHLVCFMLADGHPPDIASAVLAIMSAVYPLRHAALISETWFKMIEDATPEDVEETRKMERGELAARSETDPTVRTALMVFAIDCDDPLLWWSLNSVAVGDPRDHQWEDIERQESVQGFVPQALRKAVRIGKAAYGTAPPTDLAHCIATIGKFGLITTAMVMGGDEAAEPHPEAN